MTKKHKKFPSKLRVNESDQIRLYSIQELSIDMSRLIFTNEGKGNGIVKSMISRLVMIQLTTKSQNTHEKSHRLQCIFTFAIKIITFFFIFIQFYLCILKLHFKAAKT